jgi:hypothetical protein
MSLNGLFPPPPAIEAGQGAKGKEPLQEATSGLGLTRRLSSLVISASPPTPDVSLRSTNRRNAPIALNRLSGSASRKRSLAGVPRRVVHGLDELCRIVDMDKVTRSGDNNSCDIRLTALDVVVQSHQPW